MASTKKYYWLKLKEDFFEDDTIEWIEEQPNGEKYSLFYLKLCLKSLKTDGILIRNVGEMLIPYDVKKLAEITKTDVDTVRVAMEIFKNIGLIQILENGEIYMAQLKNMVGSETSKAQLMRNKRARDKQKALEEPKKDSGNNVTKALPNCYTEKEKEKEKDIEKEKELTDRQRERVELLRELFAGWPVSDFQIFYLSTLVNDKIPYGSCGLDQRDLKIYDYLQNLINRAKADGVTYIYRWLLKMIPEIDVD
jgi:predicted phage replisome organizer